MEGGWTDVADLMVVGRLVEFGRVLILREERENGMNLLILILIRIFYEDFKSKIIKQFDIE